jgi:Stigma-specific protein, Stig1
MERLDEFSKLLAASVSRRESLRSIGAVLAGTVFGSLGVRTAWAARPDRCTAFCRWCSTKKKRNQCVAACRACNGNTSRLCGSCGGYVCCPTGAACCKGMCTNLNSDRNNCGACGYVCAAGASCVTGTCSAVQCFGGQALCGGICREIQLDPSNCGGCGVVCGPGENCAGGLCQPAEPL